MKFEDFLYDVVKKLAKYRTLRVGQAVMTRLYEYNHSMYESILGGEYDCFYSDYIVETTLKKLKEEWE